jgi:hypothetical protein
MDQESVVVDLNLKKSVSGMFVCTYEYYYVIILIDILVKVR